MPTVYLSDTKRITDVGGLAVVEYYDVGTDTWIAEKKPASIYLEPWLADLTAGFVPCDRTNVAGTNFPYCQLEFDPAAEQCTFWRFALPHNFDPTQDIKVKVWWKAETVTVGDVVLGVSVLGRDECEDIATAALETEVEVVDTVHGTALSVVVTEITLTPLQHALAASDYVTLKLARKATDAADDMAEDADVVMVKVDFAINPAVLIEGMP